MCGCVSSEAFIIPFSQLQPDGIQIIALVFDQLRALRRAMLLLEEAAVVYCVWHLNSEVLISIFFNVM